MRFSLAFITLVLLAGTGLVFYLSWLPDPALAKYGFLPGWLARWTDAEVNDNLRTAVPFLFLGFFAGSWLSIARWEWRLWIAAFAGLVSVVVIAELGQLILPLRHFDWGDVAWGTAGSVCGMGIAALMLGVIQLALKQTKSLPHSSTRSL